MINHFSCTKCGEVLAPYRTPAHSSALAAVPFNVMGGPVEQKRRCPFLLDWISSTESLTTYYFDSGKSEHILQL